MASSILEALGELPSGKVVPFGMEDLGRFLRDNYLDNRSEAARIAESERRADFYSDRTRGHFERMIDVVFKHPDIRAERKRFIPYAKFQNITKRIVDEISTIYSEAAMRTVGSSDVDKYDELVSLPTVQINAKMRQANRTTNLQNEAFILFLVRRFDSMPQLKVLAPHEFYAIAHPMDPAHLLAIVYSVKRQGVVVRDDEPHWQAWTEWETFQLNGRGYVMSESWQEHGLGMIPGVLVHREASDAMLLDPMSGEDLISAHQAIALINIMMLKEQKSGTKQPYISGDIGNTATGQPMDSEILTVFQDGVAPGTLDLGADPSNYIQTNKNIIYQVASNKGVSEAMMDMSMFNTSSGWELQMRRRGLTEKRHQQIMFPWRPAEQQLARVMAAVCQRYAPRYSFSAESFIIDFGEYEAPLDPPTQLAYWTALREQGLMTTADIAQALNPDLTEERAVEAVAQNIMQEKMIQSLGTPATAMEPPETNGNGSFMAQPVNGPPARQ